MAYGNAKGGRAWYPEKRNPQSRDRRYWDLGADLDPNGSLRIYRKPCGADADGNKVLVIHQMDTEENPVALEVIQEGTGHAVTFKNTFTDETVGSIDASGNVSPASSATLKENFKNIGDSVAEKILGIKITSWQYRAKPGVRYVGPTAEDFKKIAGYGDGKSVNMTTFLGLTFRAMQLVFKRVKALEKRLGTAERDAAEKAKKALEDNAESPEA